MNTACPKCKCEYPYEDRGLWVCPECAYEWSIQSTSQTDAMSEFDGSVRDSNGTILQSGDSVVVIKDLKLKGSSDMIKRGTKVKNIRLSSGVDGHEISCKIDGVGSIHLKAEFVKKA